MRELIQSVTPPWLIVDGAASTVTALPGVVDFTDPAAMPMAPKLRFVPDDPEDPDPYDVVFGELRRRVFAREWPSVWVWLDEGDHAMPSKGRCSRKLRAAHTTGRKWPCGMAVCNTRPVDVARTAIANANHVVMFDTPVDDDVVTLAKNIGVPPELLRELLADLNGGLAWWERETRTIWPYERLTLPDLAGPTSASSTPPPSPTPTW